MTRARDLSNDEANGGGATPPFVAGKNKIINGDFGVSQRGITFTSVSNGAYTLDRWFITNPTNVTVSQQAFTPGAAPVSGYEGASFLRFAKSSTAVSYDALNTRIEDVRTLAGQTATLSFWAKASIGATVNINLEQNFGSGGSAAVNISQAAYTLTTSWQRFTFTVSIPSLSGKTIGTSSFLNLQAFFLAPGLPSITIDIWGVQLESGSVATPFTPAGGGHQEAELALCQRYYFRTTGGSGYQPVCNGFASSTTNVMGYVQYPVPMRTTPSAIEYATLQCNDSTIGTVVSAVAFSGTEVGPSAATLNFTCGSMTTFRPVKVLQNNSASGYLALSAEL